MIVLAATGTYASGPRLVYAPHFLPLQTGMHGAGLVKEALEHNK